MEWWQIGLVVALLGLGVVVRQVTQGSGKTYADELRQELAKRDLRLLGVRVPGVVEILRDSPYPKIEVRVGGHTEVNGVRGEFTHDRVCEVAGPEGVTEVWARLRFQAFRLVEVELRPDPGAPPAS